MPTGNLPEEGKQLFERVYQSSLEGSCNGDKECASRIAWTAVKNAGWKKDEAGQWVKTKSLAEFYLHFSKASYDKSTGTRRWAAAASDTDADAYSDNMSIQLFQDFLSRIEAKDLPPEQFRSDFWSGGLPYLSLSHYLDLEGKAAPGVTESVYIDGNFLKARGTFSNTPLGQACFDAVCKDMYGDVPHPEGKIRISISFVDWMHQHKSGGYVFTRNTLEDVCSECVKEQSEGNHFGLTFLKGQLIHLALTRVPVNTRTSVEVIKSMAIQTRRDDAASIVGDELANEIDTQSQLVGKSQVALVTKSEVEPEVDKSTFLDAPVDQLAAALQGEYQDNLETTDVQEKSDMTDEEKKKMAEDMQAKMCSDIVSALAPHFSELKSEIATLRSEHELDSAFFQLRSSFDEIMKSELSGEEKLRAIQEPYAAFGNSIVETVRAKASPQISPVQTSQVASDSSDLVKAFSEALAPLTQKLDILNTRLSEQRSMVAPSEQLAIPQIPQRRSIPNVPQIVQPVVKSNASGMSIRDIVANTTK